MSITILISDPDTGLQLYSNWRAGSGSEPQPLYALRRVPPRALPAHLASANDETLAANFAAFERITQFLRDNPD